MERASIIVVTYLTYAVAVCLGCSEYSEVESCWEGQIYRCDDAELAAAFVDSIESEQKWVGVWGGPRVRFDSEFAEGLNDQSLRIIVRPALGGEILRVGFTNIFGQEVVTIGAARIALSGGFVDGNKNTEGLSAEVVPETDTPLTFSGQTSVEIPAFEDVLSDPVRFPFSFGDMLAVSFHIIKATHTSTTRNCIGTFRTLTSKGDVTQDVSGDLFPVVINDINSCAVLNRIDVLHEGTQGTVVAIGDSITSGSGSAKEGMFASWPLLLAERINAAGMSMGVLNMGIAANTVTTMPSTSSNLALLSDAGPIRFERDVIQQTNVRTVIIALGGNDLRDLAETNTQMIIDGLQDMIDKGRAANMRVLLATIPPSTSDTLNPNGDDERRIVNSWIHNHQGIEGWLPFDETLRNPTDMDRILNEYDIDGDNIHPEQAGRQALADAIPLDLL